MFDIIGENKKILEILKFSIDNAIFLWYNIQAFAKRTSFAKKNGGIAQLARATGSYPVGHGFKSNSRYQIKMRMKIRIL